MKADEREAWIDQAFYGVESRLHTQLDLQGSVFVCTTRMVKTLLTFGCLPSQQHSLSRLLSVMQPYYGVQDHAEFEALIARLDTLCGQVESAPPVPVVLPITPVQSVDTPLAQQSATVFVSYSHEDSRFASTLIAALNGAGYAVWIDNEALKVGERWSESIARGIRQSYAFVVVCTRRALESRYVKAEIRWAVDNDKLIIPVLLEDVTREDAFFDLKPHQGVTFFNQSQDAALRRLIRELPRPQIALPDGDMPTLRPPTSRRTHELAYLDRLRFEDFRLEKFELAEYAPLSGTAQTRHAVRDSWAALAMKQEFVAIPYKQRDDMEIESSPEAFTDAVSKITDLRRVVVLGEPGAGKTHTLRALAKPLYSAALTDASAPIPLLVKLGNWDTPNQPFEAFLRGTLGELGTALDELLAAKRVILLLDGLNEFPADQRAAKYPQVEAFIKAQPDVRAVVTCREADYPISLHLNKVLIRPLDPLRIRDFARRALRLKSETEGDAFFWKLAGERAQTYQADFVAKVGGPHEAIFWTAAQLPDDLKWTPYDWDTKNEYSRWGEWLRVRDNPSSLLTLASNPYLLRMLLDVYIQFKGELPDNRGQLFDQFVNVLLAREKLAQIDQATQAVTLTNEGWSLLQGLQAVAYAMQIQRATQTEEGETSAGTALPLEKARRMLDERLLYLAVSTSILNTGDSVRFSHQLLQEYFAAVYLRERIFVGTTPALSETAPIMPERTRTMAASSLQAADIWKPERWWERTNWEEAVILLAGLYSDDCTPILDWLAEANPEVAVQCILRSGATTPDATKTRLRDQWLPRLTDLQREPEPKARAAVGRALGLFQIDGRMADNRRGVGLREDGLPDLDWVEIPAGEFDYGQEDERDNPPQRLNLPQFSISRYLVTYEQFGAFLAASDGFYNPLWWEGLAADDEHKQMGEQQFKFANHPRETVNGYAAVAFCRWLTAQYRAAGKSRGGAMSPPGIAGDHVGSPLRDDWVIRLPTSRNGRRRRGGRTGSFTPTGTSSTRRRGTREKQPSGKRRQWGYSRTGRVRMGFWI